MERKKRTEREGCVDVLQAPLSLGGWVESEKEIGSDKVVFVLVCGCVCVC